MLNIQPPQALRGDEQTQLEQLYRYLYSLSDDLNAALSGLDERTVVLQTSSAGGASPLDQKVSANIDQQAQTLKSLILKTAHTVRTEMDVLETELNMKIEAQSDWGSYQEQIQHLVQETAESTLESYDFVSNIESLQSQAADFDSYMVHSKGYINQGIIGYGEDNYPIFGIAIGENLQTKEVTIGDNVYEEIDTTHRYATYTPDRLSFWLNGVEVAYMSNSQLYITRAIILDSIMLGDWEIDVSKADGLSIQKHIGNALDLSGNSTITLTADMINAVADDIGVIANDKVNITAAKINAVADQIDLHTNQSMLDVTDAKIETVVGALTLGGRNLLTGTRDFDGDWVNIDLFTRSASKKDGILTILQRANSNGRGVAQSFMATKDETYTASAWVWTGAATSFTWYADAAGSAITASDIAPYSKTVDVPAEVWKRVSFTFKVAKAGVIQPRIGCDSDSVAWGVCGMKLERGTKATDWTQAPEDIDEDFDTVQENFDTYYDTNEYSLQTIRSAQSKMNEELENLGMAVVGDSQGLHVHRPMENPPCEALIDDHSLNVKVGNAIASSFASSYIEQGGQIVARVTSNGIILGG